MELPMVERQAGQHVREWTRRTALRGLVAIGGVLLIGVAVGVAAGFTSWTFIVAELAVLIALVAIDRQVVPIVDRRDRGATAEEYVGALLEQLVPEGWRVLHDVNTGRGNVDHVVPGARGRLHSRDEEPRPGEIERLTGALLSR
jgi:hypothetical protein